MDRRRFLGLAAAATAALAIDPERLLWAPGKRTHFDLWTRPTVAVGDFVSYQASALLGGHSMTGREWVYLPTDAIQRIEPKTRGLVGLVTQVRGRAAIVQIYGPASVPAGRDYAMNTTMLAHPYLD